MLLLALLALADWPHVRGPALDGTAPETGLAEAWPDGGPPVLWARELGTGYSAFAVAGEFAVTLYQTPGGIFLAAFEAGTGAERWSRRVDGPWQLGGMYPGPYAAPTIAGGRVFFAAPSGRIGCVELADGTAVWSLDLRERFGTRGTDFGYAAAPTVEAGRVYLPAGGREASLVALDAGTGETAWAAGGDAASYCPVLPIPLDGRRLLVGFLQNALTLHDANTGERLWRHRLSDHYDEHSTAPMFDGRHLLVASPFRAGTKAFRLELAGAGVSAKEVWSGNQLSNDVCSSVLVAGSVYGFDIRQAQASTHRPARGSFRCLDALTGRVRWDEPTVGQGTPIAVDGKLVIWTETGELVLARLDPERFAELGRARLLGGGGMCWAAPALSGRRLFVRDARRAMCVHLGPAGDLSPERRTAPVVVAESFRWSDLTPVEPDFANDAPTAAEVGRWFAWNLGVFLLAGLVAGTGRLAGSTWHIRIVAALVALVLGAVGTTAVGAWAGVFAPTWPAALWAALRLTIAAGDGRRPVSGRLALAALVALCYGYYRLCMAVGWAMGWGFLAGLIAGVPFAVCCSRLGERRPRLRWSLEAAGFAAFFWAGGMLPALKAAW